jgi:hypothetical protein
VTDAPGFNPLRWNCEAKGCFNAEHRFRIEVFAECLPGRSGFGDVDGLGEVNGHFLFLEFKGAADATAGPVRIPTGQRIAHERLTALSSRINTIVIAANVRRSEVFGFWPISGGKVGQWWAVDLDGLKEHVRRWAVRSAAAPREAAA